MSTNLLHYPQRGWKPFVESLESPIIVLDAHELAAIHYPEHAHSLGETTLFSLCRQYLDEQPVDMPDLALLLLPEKHRSTYHGNLKKIYLQRRLRVLECFSSCQARTPPLSLCVAHL